MRARWDHSRLVLSKLRRRHRLRSRCREPQAAGRGALDLGATPRGAPRNLHFKLDARTLKNGSHFTFKTKYGSLDILSDRDGAPAYDKLRAAGLPQDFEGEPIHVASLDHPIAMKDASARTRIS
jgi:hypothetical protein